MSSPKRLVKERVGIVFLHHLTDEITSNNLQSFRDWNPDATIVTVSAGERFPGGYCMRDFPDYFEMWRRHTSGPNAQAQSPDLLLYAWYHYRRESCVRWVVVEWDAFCAMSIEDFFAPVWAFDVVAPCVRWPNREPEWHWFSTIETMPADLQPFAVGAMPLCFILVRDSVLKAICQRVCWKNIGACNCELRFGTLAYACGFVPVANPLAGWNITWKPLPITTPLHTGMWHPVKWLATRRRPSESVKLSSETPVPRKATYNPLGATRHGSGGPLVPRKAMRNLIYTVAFDPQGELFHQMMAKILISSIFRSGFAGDVLILTNSPVRVFEHGRRNLQEMSFDTSKVKTSALSTEAQRFKFKARTFINLTKYEKVMFVDCDCLCMKNPDVMLVGSEDIAYTEETFNELTGNPNNAYLKPKEMQMASRPGINSGTWWVRAKYFKKVLEEWERVDSTQPRRKKYCGDQPAWVRVLLDTKLQKRPFALGKEVKFPTAEMRTVQDFDDCVFQHFCGIPAVNKLAYLYTAYIRRFHSGTAYGMMSLADG